MSPAPQTLIFAGPSLFGCAFRPAIEPLLRPPVCAGDLMAAAAGLPAGALLLIIDGEFGQSQAVTVSEIRAVLQAGYRVWGASSMGAIRAVECAPLGMAGTGQVWDDYAKGRIVADDEVALIYDPESFAPATVPLVNVRALARLLTALGAGPGTSAAFLDESRKINFRYRTWTAVRSALERTMDAYGSGQLSRDPSALLHEPARRVWDVKLQDAENAVRRCLIGPDPLPTAVAGPVPYDWRMLLSQGVS